MKKANYPSKTSMNLLYKPDTTTKSSTTALYVLFALVVLLALAKFLGYDLWEEKWEAEQRMIAARDELSITMLQLADYNEVRERYIRYFPTEEEEALVDRMEVLAMLEDTMAGNAELNSISITGSRVQIQLSNVTLAETAGIVNRLEASPLVAGTVVNTASTTDQDGDLVRANIVVQLQKEADGE